MKSFNPSLRTFLARALAPILVARLVVPLAGCGPAADSKSPATTTPSSKSTAAKSGLTLKSDGLMIDASTGTSMLPGYAIQPLSFRIMSGWVNQEKFKLANQETDPAEKRKKLMKTFGLVTLQVSAAKAAPGTYQLAPEGKGPQTGSVDIDKNEDAGIAHNYTAQSGTLNIKSVTMNDAGKQVSTVEGSFEGQFKSAQGDSRAFSGSFQLVPKN